jgi:phosphate ABC transporter phosphate-binding protein
MNRRTLFRRLAAVSVVAFLVGSGSATPASARGDYQRISGEGSSWAANFIDAMRVNVRQFGITVDYNPSGSTSGRKNFLNGTVDFAASDIPFQFTPEDGSAPENPAPGSYAYMPVVAGGTAFIYNLTINGQRVTNLRVSGENVVKIFTGAITSWNDPALQADNPGITLPGRAIVPVVRSDGSGSSAQFTLWMIAQHKALWDDYCQRSGRAPACGETSFYPTIPGMIAQAGDIGISGYVSQGFAEGAIGYVNYSYALGNQLPVAKVLNAAGYYTEPTPQNVAVSLLQARVNQDASNPAVYLTQQLDGVYTDPDPRNYPLSSYSYFILPTKVAGQFTEDKGKTLGAFAYYSMCQGQQQSASLGYSPMPVNLVEASFEQIRKIPGVVVQDIDITACKNPTFAADGSNLLADTAPQPQACDKQGSAQCPDGTGGLKNQPTAVTGGGGVVVVVVAKPNAGSGAGAGTGAGGAAPGDPAAAVDASAGAASGAAPAGGAGAAPAAGGPATGAGATPAAAAAGTATGAGAAPGAGAAAQVCDADTGLCSGSASPVAAGAAGTGQAGAATGVAAAGQTAAGPVGPSKNPVLKPDGGWGTAVQLLLVALFTLGLVLGPAAAWRYFAVARPV